MAALASYLPEPLASEALDVARRAARADDYSEKEGLGLLAMHLPDVVAAEFSELWFGYDADGVALPGALIRARRWAASVASWERVAELAARAARRDAAGDRAGRGTPEHRRFLLR
jgi:hypothetical protein